MTDAGVDYSAGHPGGAALKAARVRFAARYVSHTASKNITASEATDLSVHGVWTVLVWETTASRAGAGRAAGITDAHDALTQATAAGMPSSRPLYFAVDWDADPTVVDTYFEGVASVLGLDRTGVYGGYKVVKHLLDSKLATWAWQTAAWSGGKWDARAHIRQPATTVHINGVACDNDTAYAADYGQWMPGKSPEVDVALTTDDINKVAAAVVAKLIAGGGVLETSDLTNVAKAVLNADGLIDAPADAPDIKTNPYWALQSYIKDTNAKVRAIQTLLAGFNGEQIAADAAAALGAYQITVTKES